MIVLTTVAQAEEFFKRCEERRAETLQERLKIMEEMIKERRVFKQTEEQLKKRMKGKNVLHIKRKL